MDFIKDLGLLALGSRLRRMSDRIMASGIVLYRHAGFEFEPTWFPVFRVLADRGELSVGECAHHLGLTHAAVSQMARKLVSRGLVTASRDVQDERRKVLSLSAKGQQLLPQLAELWDDIEACIADAVEYSGVDILAALEGLESAMAVSSLSDRVAERRRQRQLDVVQIVELDEALAPEFKRLNYEWLEKYFRVEPIDVEVLSHPEAIVNDGGAVLFALSGGDTVGTVALMRDGDEVELIKMAVTESWQGKGIGAKLLLAAIDRARDMGLDALFLITNSSLTPAVHLYRKHGFRVVQSEPSSKYERGDLRMELKL